MSERIAAARTTNSAAQDPCLYNAFHARNPQRSASDCSAAAKGNDADMREAPRPSTGVPAGPAGAAGALTGQAPVTKIASTTAVAKTAAPELAAKANELTSSLLEERNGLVDGMDNWMTRFYVGRISADEAQAYRGNLEIALSAAEEAVRAGADSDSLGDACAFLKIFKSTLGWSTPHKVATGILDWKKQTLEDDSAVMRIRALHNALKVPETPVY